MLTHLQARDYVRLHMDEVGYSGVMIIGSAACQDFPPDEVQAIDVMFYLPGKIDWFVFTVWLLEDGQIYGEW